MMTAMTFLAVGSLFGEMDSMMMSDDEAGLMPMTKATVQDGASVVRVTNNTDYDIRLNFESKDDSGMKSWTGVSGTSESMSPVKSGEGIREFHTDGKMLFENGRYWVRVHSGNFAPNNQVEGEALWGGNMSITQDFPFIGKQFDQVFKVKLTYHVDEGVIDMVINQEGEQPKM